ncbi:MAG: UDP-2,3-diacylglucosamine diphosphatase [Rubrivivax sp.]
MPAGGAVPAWFEFKAPADWRCIDFISDLHLSAALPRTTAAWERQLLQTPADAVVMLGDLFEVWVGDDARSLPFEQHCVEVMAEAASRRTLAVMVGNRDFLLGAQMLRACGAMALPDPTLLQAWGQHVLLSHGDALCLDDSDYQAFRREVRSSRWQAEFLAKPLSERLAIAADIRRQSQMRQSFDGRADADIDTATAVAWLHTSGAAELVHGHTHRPGSQGLAPGFKRHVLSDWDLDDAARPRAEVLRLTRNGFQRLAPP